MFMTATTKHCADFKRSGEFVLAEFDVLPLYELLL